MKRPAFIGKAAAALREDRKLLAIIAAASVLWALCFPPFPFGPVIFVALVPLFLATARLKTGGRAFWFNFLGGILHNTVMYWWIYNVIKVGPALIIGFGLLLLILYLSLFNALLGWLFRACAHRRFGLAIFTVMWGGLEVLRTWGQISFPWSHIGYTLGHFTALIQGASFLGIFGLSLAVVACNCLVFAALRRRGLRRAAWMAAALVIPLALWIEGAVSLKAPDPQAGTLDIALVQPSIPQTKKWDEHYFHDVMDKTWRTIAGDSGKTSPLMGADLVVFAETAVPDFLRSRGDIYLILQGISQRYGSDVVVGALDFVPDNKPYRAYQYFNSAFLFPGSGRKDSVLQYSKLRLVPFSEKLPFDNIFPVINYVNLGEGDFSPGDDYAVWGRKTRYAPSICYEIIYPDFVRGARRRGANLLVNITNDGWFGYSNAPFQHANIARFRAIEAGVPIARCSNSGISVFYDYKGRIVAKTHLFEQTLLRRQIPLASRETWYLKHGDAVENFLGWFFPLGLAGLAGLSISERRKKRRHP
jgi:apolipoprotein N-acyltransferase